MAKLYFRYGAMNSGKSTALIQVAHNYEERGQRVLVVKPAVDTKSATVLSRISVARAVDLVTGDTTDVRAAVLAGAPVDCVLVDEAQFLTPAQVDDLFVLAVSDGVPVIAYGLRSDFRTRGFPGSIRLMELAHTIEELKTVCRCGRKAVLNARTVDGGFTRSGDQVAIDAGSVASTAADGMDGGADRRADGGGERGAGTGGGVDDPAPAPVGYEAMCGACYLVQVGPL